MNTRAIRESLLVATLLTLILAMVGCGGGTGSSTDTGGTIGAPSGPAEVVVTFSGAAETPTVASPLSLSPSGAAPTADPSFFRPREIREFGPTIEHVYVDVVRVSLMPADEPFESGDMDGDVEDAAPANPAVAPEVPRFVSIVADPPVRIDLLNLEVGEELASLLGRFESVPAGTYDKIRVQYRGVKVVLADGTALHLHPTMRSRFDIHFREGHELVIPPGTDASQPGWFNLFQVKIEVAGVKVKIVSSNGWYWRGCRLILRPQIFAEAGDVAENGDTPPQLVSMRGTVASVAKDGAPPVSGSFQVALDETVAQTTAPSTPVTAAFDASTTWKFSDNVRAGSTWVVNVSAAVGAAALQERAIVEVQGSQDAGGVLRASDVTITFPDVLNGTADHVWEDGSSMELYWSYYRAAVYPMPDRFTAYYDDSTTPTFDPLLESDIRTNALLKVRGYATPGSGEAPAAIDAWWLTWKGEAGI